MKKYFWYWWIYICSVVAFSVIMYNVGVFGFIFKHDITYITSALISTFALLSAHIGWRTYKFSYLDQYTDTRTYWFITNQFPVLGIIGTFIGLILMFHGSFLNFVPGDVGLSIQLIKDIGSGFMVAMTTSLVGLVSMLLLRIQLENLDYGIDNYE